MEEEIGVRHKNNILYYLGFYFLIFIINIFKIIKESPSWFSQWREFFNITLDLSFTWSGVIIALLTNFEKQWHSTIFISSIIVFIISIFTNVYSTKIKPISLSLNIFLISFVLISTYYVYAFKIPSGITDTNGLPIEEDAEQIKKVTGYKIIIPYKDPSIATWLSNSELDDRYFYFEHTSKLPNKDSALKEAVKVFWADSIECIYNPNTRKANKFRVKLLIEKTSLIDIYN